MIGFQQDYIEHYVLLYTDFGFWKIFGNEQNKELLISFLNSLFQGEHNITDVQYLNNYAMFDVCCQNDKGERFVVEMQQAYQQYYKDLAGYYSSFRIQNRAKYGEWNFKIDGIYTIGILNFVFPENEHSPEYIHREVKEMDTTERNNIFNKINHIYLELPKFNKKEEELETMFDKWMFVLRNLTDLKERPAALKEPVFTRLFEQAEIANFTSEEKYSYHVSIKNFRDYNNVVNTARMRGYLKGVKKNIEDIKKKGIVEDLEVFRFNLALDLLKYDFSLKTIIQTIEMPENEVEKLKEYLKNNPIS